MVYHVVIGWGSYWLWALGGFGGSAALDPPYGWVGLGLAPPVCGGLGVWGWFRLCVFSVMRSGVCW